MATDDLPFEILEVLGEGAFGAVCVGRMRNDPLRRIVAIKILKRAYATNERVLHRTRDEARLLSRLEHPNIVRVEQLTEAAGRPVVVMELVRGLDLKTVLRRQPKGLPAAVALELIRRTCLALHAAFHEVSTDDGAPLRVVHRDIKPSNMLLSVHGQLKVVDFGIATGQFDDREAHTESLVMGSRAYMAPERLDGSKDTPAVDVYSAGMSLFELLTGRVMGLSVNPASHDRSLARHVEMLAPSGMDAGGMDDLRRLVHRMCAYDADLRPTALDAAAELDLLIAAVRAEDRTSVEDFARDVVQPLYEERKRAPLATAIAALEDGEFLGNAASRAPASLAPPPSHELHRRPALFLGALLGATLSLGGVAANKAMVRQTDRTVAAPIRDLARVRFWFPSDATARVGTYGLAVPGHIMLTPGPAQLDLTFGDGATLVCPFRATDGAAVRFVLERGKPAVSVDDGPALPCHTPGPEGDPG